MNRRNFLGCASVVGLALTSSAFASVYGGAHADDVIPVTSLTPGTFSANSFPGFTSPATTVHVAGGFDLLSPNPDNDLLVATTNLVVRDSQCSTYFFERGAILLRLNGSPGSQTCFFFEYNAQASAGGAVNLGIKTGFDSTQPYEGNGTNYGYYFNVNLANSPEGIAAGFTNAYSSGDLFTFGVQGFTVFLQWNGIDIIRYTEWRLMTPGQSAVWAHNGLGTRDITVHYPTPTFIFSNPAAQIYDPRDFGMRNVAATTGSMTAGSNQITGVTPGTFQVDDQIIVLIGGETGVGVRGTIGVGGTWPTLNYPNMTVMNADNTQPVGTFAYDASSRPLAVYAWNGSNWTHTQNGGGGGYTAQSYYTYLAVPLPLVATVTNVSGTTVTLNSTSLVAATNADNRLHCLPSFNIFNQPQPVGSFAPTPVNITLAIPSSQGTADQCWYISNAVTNAVVKLVGGVTVSGAGRTLTTLKTPKSCPPAAFNFNGISANGFVISDMKYIGNNGASGFGFFHGTNTFGSYATAFSLASPGAVNTGLVIRNIDGSDTVGVFAGIVGSSPLIDNCTAVMNGQQYDYVQWQFILSNSSGGKIQNCTATGTFLLKSFEMFACNGAKIVNCGGTNPLYSTNSSSNWTIDCRGLTINYTAGAYINQQSGAIDEAIFNVNDNAFRTGNTGTIYLGRHIQQGYINASKDSLKFIQVATAQSGVSIIGSYPGAGGCSTSLDGLLQAPDYVRASVEFGAIIYSDAVGTVVSGVRIKGAAIGKPGHSGHFGNISLLGASSQINNCVVDAIQAGPMTSGNETNTAYGGC